MVFRFALAAVVVGAAVLAAACGYTLAGRGNSLPASVVAIGIPQFENQSVVPDIDRPMTEAVRVEFQSKGRYRILPVAQGADAVLTVRIVNVVVQPIAFTTQNQVSRNAIVVVAAVEFKEVAADRVIWANPSFQVRDEYDVTTGTVANDPNALLTGNENALDRLSRAFARSVVTSIFEAF